MPPRSWASSPRVPTRQDDHLGDVRPLDAHALGLKRNRSAGDVLSPTVRSTKAHTIRAQRAFHVMDKHREEGLLEHARFENAVYEGKWRDPLLDNKGRVPEHAIHEKHEWLGANIEELDPLQQLASRILFGVHDAATRSKGGVKALFAAENKGGPGVLEPQDFLAGLVRLGVLIGGDVGLDDIIKVIAVIDPSSDGRMRLPALDRAVGVARRLHKQQQEAWEKSNKDRQVFLSTNYGDSLPVSVIKIDKQPKSIHTFERSLEKFRSQQRELLVHHNEYEAE